MRYLVCLKQVPDSTVRVKVGSDGTKKAIDGLKDESAKAQAFATHMDRGEADRAVETYQRLRPSE